MPGYILTNETGILCRGRIGGHRDHYWSTSMEDCCIFESREYAVQTAERLTCNMRMKLLLINVVDRYTLHNFGNVVEVRDGLWNDKHNRIEPPHGTVVNCRCVNIPTLEGDPQMNVYTYLATRTVEGTEKKPKHEKIVEGPELVAFEGDPIVFAKEKLSKLGRTIPAGEVNIYVTATAPLLSKRI